LSVNRIGLGALLDVWLPQRSPAINWIVYGVGFCGFIVLCTGIVRNRLAFWHTFVASGLLLYFFASLSSYDYVWLVCLVPACLTSKFRTVLLLGLLISFNAFTEFSFGFVPEILMSVVASVFLALFFTSYTVQLFHRPAAVEDASL
jgi:hypothetical protein